MREANTATLEEKKLRLKSLKAMQAEASVQFTPLRVLVVVIVVFALFFGILIGESGNIWLWMGCGVAFVGLAVCSVQSIRNAETFRPEMKLLAKEISEMSRVSRELGKASRELANAEQSLSRLDPQTYGCSTTEGLLAVQAARRDLIRCVMGEDAIANLMGRSRQSTTGVREDEESYALILDSSPDFEKVSRAIRRLRPDKRLAHVTVMAMMGGVVVLEKVREDEAEAARRKIAKAGGKARVVSGHRIPASFRRL